MFTKVSERNLYLYPNLEAMQRSKRIKIRTSDLREVELELVKLEGSPGARTVKSRLERGEMREEE